MKRRKDTDPYTYIPNIIKSNISNDYKIFWFGSRARGDSDAYSDWDIGILGNKPFDYKSLLHISALMDETPWNVDIVDFYGRDDHFAQQALKNIKYI